MEARFISEVAVSDQGRNNLKMRSLFDMNVENPFIEVNNVYFFSLCTVSSEITKE